MRPYVPLLQAPTTANATANTPVVDLCDARLVPSGIFVVEDPHTVELVPLCNPYFEQPSSSESLQLPPCKTRDLKRNFNTIAEVQANNLKDYGRMIAQVRAVFTLAPVDAVVVPLCGALRPASCVLPMGNFDLKMIPVPFTRGSTGNYDREILDVLGESLQALYAQDPLTLAVLDTGIGGQSMLRMAALLRQLHDDVAPQCLWKVRFNTIISADNMGYLDRTNRIKKLESDRFVIERMVFPTTHLLGEDHKAALRYVVDWNNPSAGYVEQTVQPGALVIRSPEQLKVIVSDDLGKAVDEAMSDAVTAHLQGPNGLFLGNIWEPPFNHELPKDPQLS